MYRVSWEEKAMIELLEQTAHSEQQFQAAAVAASLEVERLLATQPHEVGESRELATRVLIVPPLTITFHINHFEQQVFISSVRVHTPPGA